MEIEINDILKTTKTRSTYISWFPLMMFFILGMNFNMLAYGGKTTFKGEQEEVIKKICTYLEDNYIYPETGKEVSKQILGNHKDGKYSKLTSPADFAYQLMVYFTIKEEIDQNVK